LGWLVYLFLNLIESFPCAGPFDDPALAENEQEAAVLAVANVLETLSPSTAIFAADLDAVRPEMAAQKLTSVPFRHFGDDTKQLAALLLRDDALGLRLQKLTAHTVADLEVCPLVRRMRRVDDLWCARASSQSSRFQHEARAAKILMSLEWSWLN
jgi:hypothetical protein